MEDKLEKGDRITFQISEQNGWVLEQEFEITDVNCYRAKVRPVGYEISFVTGHEAMPWPEVSYQARHLGDPTCPDCVAYNLSPDTELLCQEHQVID